MSRFKLESISRIYITAIQWLFALLAFSIPFPQKFPLPVLWMIGILWLAEWVGVCFRNGGFSVILSRLASNGRWWVLVSFFLLVALYLLSMAWTDNLLAARFELERKSLFLMLPLVAFTLPREVFGTGFLKKALAGFLSGLLLVSLFLLIRAIRAWDVTGDAGLLYYSRLSMYLHPTYLSLYCSFAIGTILVVLTERPSNLPLSLRWMLAALVPFWGLFILMLASKAGLLSLAIVMLFFLIRLIRKSRNKWYAILVVSLVLLATVVSVPFSGAMKTRLLSMKNTRFEMDKIRESRHPDGIMIRIVSWDIAFDLWREAPFTGTGAGDYREKTMQEITAWGFAETFGGFKNAHNQYLQTLATTGIFGVIALVLWLLMPLLSLRRPRPPLYALFVILIAINLLFESMLETQSGVLFITLFQTLLFVEGKFQTGRKEGP